MNDIIQSIDPDKRDRIINAAIEEFSSYPYDKASTNNIVKKAGISKGLLFHYFGNKETLYDTLVQFVIDSLYRSVVEKIDWEESDLFERLKQITIVKMRIGRNYPQMFDFMTNIVMFNGAAKMESVFKLYRSYGFDFEQLYQDVYTRNIDYSKFRDPSNIAETVNIVRWSLEKYAEEKLLVVRKNGKPDYDSIAADLAHYVDILKKAFYVQ